jgi:hypothetical protein
VVVRPNGILEHLAFCAYLVSTDSASLLLQILCGLLVDIVGGGRGLEGGRVGVRRLWAFDGVGGVGGVPLLV